MAGEWQVGFQVGSQEKSGLVRFGVSMDKGLLERFDRLISEKGYPNRSEAFRDLVRENLVEEEWRAEHPDGEVAATVTFVYDHHASGLDSLLNEVQHDHHALVLAATHVHLDHDNCLEGLLLRGSAPALKSLADRLTSLKGVKFGRLTLATTGRGLS